LRAFLDQDIIPAASDKNIANPHELPLFFAHVICLPCKVTDELFRLLEVEIAKINLRKIDLKQSTLSLTINEEGAERAKEFNLE
jgi:hypothetical protein